MRKLLPSLIALSLLAAPAAHAQFGGGGGGGGGHGRGGGGGGPPPSSGPDSGAAPAPPRQRQTPTDQVDIVGVVESIGPEPDRITIAYDQVDALGWPPGSMPFVVAKTDLLKGLTVGEKVRFRLDSQQISDIGPYRPHPSPFAPQPVLPQPPP